MKQPIRRCIVCFAAMVTGGLTASVLPAATASAAEKPAVLILGDSISSGYGLKAGEACFTEYLADYTGGTLTNLAVPGSTTFDLIDLLDDASKADTIKSADIICISIGANDLMQPTKEYFNTLRQDDETAFQLMKRLASEKKATQFISGLTGVLRDPRGQAVDNYPVIAEKLRALNPNAKIIMQTIYNPYELPERYFTQQDYSKSDYQDYLLFSKYVAGNLAQLNKAMAALEGIEIADVAAAFSGVGWIFCRTLETDVHPTALGHAMIGAVIMDMLGTAKKTYPAILPMIAVQDYSDYLRIGSSYRSSLMKYTEGKLGGTFGDANSDGEILIDDAQAVLNLYVDKMASKSVYGEGVTYEGFFQIDINLDGNVSVEDAQYILMYYVETQIVRKPASWADIIGNPNVPKS